MDYHILAEVEDGKTIQVVFHFPVPAGTNQAGNSWQDCIKEEAEMNQGGTISSFLPSIDSGELADLQSGTLLEKVHTVRFSTLNPPALQKKAEIEAAYNVQLVDHLDWKQRALQWWGYEDNVS